MSNKKLLGVLGVIVVIVGVGAMLFGGGTQETNLAEENVAQVETTTEDVQGKEAQEEDQVAQEEQALNSQETTSGLVDGVYLAKHEVANEAGWKTFMEVTIQEGKIVSVNFDEINEQEEINSQNNEVKDQLENMLIETQDPTAIQANEENLDVSSTFQDFAIQILEQAKVGNTDIIMVTPSTNQ